MKGFAMDDLVVMTRDQVRAFDARAINELKVPSVVLMENAGRGCAEVIIGMGPEKDGFKKAVIFCGTGNNGGDGYVIGRHLRNHGINAEFVICGDKNKIAGDALINLKILENTGADIKVIDVNTDNIGRQVEEILTDGKFDVIVDALFGTGLKGTLRGGYADVIASINHAGLPVAAVDIPSGLDCDTGLPLDGPDGKPIAVKADFTVTFVAVKKGFYQCERSADYTGEVFVASIGIEPGLQ
jgi:NAD(P)H-hydrate epimerase